MADSLLEIDHLVWVVPSLPEGIAAFEALTGVAPTIGGQHQGIGTHNALLSFGDGRYLELLARDPAQESGLPWLGVDVPAQPCLTTFCARLRGGGEQSASTLEEFIARVQASGYDAGLVDAMSRQTQEGKTVRWRLAARNHKSGYAHLPGGGLIPFLIDWSPNELPHPSQTAPSGCTLVAMRAWHPDPASVVPVLSSMGATGCFESDKDGSCVGQGDQPRIEIVLDTPKGRVTLS
mmetsp:Transcript_8997/g.16238  ORF Transcript_8997/g.16238 Transcript_8997/m.16238 type:complete len:235 (+) Transcript_8997:42-746(+)